jgi:hypothetical protein
MLLLAARRRAVSREAVSWTDMTPVIDTEAELVLMIDPYMFRAASA